MKPVSGYSVPAMLVVLLLTASACSAPSAPSETGGASKTAPSATASPTRTRPRPEAVTSVAIDTTRTLTVNGTFQGYGVQDDSYMLWNPANTTLGAAVPIDYDT